ncbi:hypothetical protein [Photobacterium lutimaris]|nr:hypothetical protein [Photobacterium lutimaris]TDR75120.1 hypothetical protein DFP78_105137 [Photobacterium lutimaris]
MLGRVITTLGMCVIGGKYLLMLIIAGIAMTTGSGQADMMQLAMLEPAE